MIYFRAAHSNLPAARCSQFPLIQAHTPVSLSTDFHFRARWTETREKISFIEKTRFRSKKVGGGVC
jgi:hypothetical protein